MTATSSPRRLAAEIYVSGRVQGVGYRFFTEKAAAELGISGWSKNLPDGRVMLDVEGDKNALERFISALKEGPRMARVSEVNVAWKPCLDAYQGFHIRF